MSLLRVNLQEVVQNLSNCNVKTEGICCYFPQYCEPLAKCYSTTPTSLVDLPGTFPRCMCPDGYEGDGRTKGSGCRNVDECERGIAQCQHMCVDLIPGFRCDCRTGWRLQPDGRSCRDIDECQEQTHHCSHLCRNTRGSYVCECPPGFRLGDDLRTCFDIDECSEGGANVCPYPELCTNTEGSYHCGCPPGLSPGSYHLTSPISAWSTQSSATCEDDNECVQLGSDACPNSIQHGRVTQVCENVYGAHLCRCLPGTRSVKANTHLQDWVSTEGKIHRVLQDAIDNDYYRTMNAFHSESVTELVDVELSQSDAFSFESVQRQMVEDTLSEESASISMLLSSESIESFTSEPASDIEFSTQTTPADSFVHPFAKYDEQIARHEFVYGRQHAGEELLNTEILPVGVPRMLESQPASNDGIDGFDEEYWSHNEFHNLPLKLLETRRQKAAAQRESLVCEDINECEEGTDSCPRETSRCVNTFRSYECVCNEPEAVFNEETKTCDKVVATAENPASCDEHMCHSPCQLTSNGYFCGCPKGYIADTTLSVEGSVDKYLRNERAWQAALTNLECHDIDECALPGVKMCGINCECRNTVGSYDCACPDTHKHQVAAMSDDYDFLLAIGKQFAAHVSEYDEKTLIRVLNRNGPRNAATAWLSIPAGSLLETQWMVDQVDWTKAGFINVDPAFERSLRDLSASSNLTRDFIRETVAALRSSRVNMCLRQSPCHPGSCSASKPCCKAHPNGSHQCFAIIKPLLRVGSKKGECPPGSVLSDA